LAGFLRVAHRLIGPRESDCAPRALCADAASKSGHFDPAQFEDRYETALVELLKKKEVGEKIEPAKAGPAPRVVNLMDALRASLDASKKKAPAPSVQARRPAKKKAGQK
jgi:DNA end-binding protein Ku